MRYFPLLVVVLGLLGSSLPQSYADSVGKLSGTFKGTGTFVDNSNPETSYKYTFDDVVASVAKTGKIKGSTKIFVSSTTGGVTTRYPGFQTLKIKGSIISSSIQGGKLTALGELDFSNGSSVDGMISVSAKTGKGTLEAKSSNPLYRVKFLLRKSS